MHIRDIAEIVKKVSTKVAIINTCINTYHFVLLLLLELIIGLACLIPFH